MVLNGNNKVIKQDLITGDTIWIMPIRELHLTDLQWLPESFMLRTGPEELPYPTILMLQVFHGERQGLTIKQAVEHAKAVYVVIDPKTGTKIKELLVGLHPNEIISDKHGRYVYVTNSNSDNVTVINTLIDEITETISVRLQPEINPFFGDSPNGLCLSGDEKTLFVANGMDNALAVIRLSKRAARKGKGNTSIITGFIPTGAYPSGICQLPSGKLYVANLEATGARLALNYSPIKESDLQFS